MRNYWLWVLFWFFIGCDHADVHEHATWTHVERCRSRQHTWSVRVEHISASAGVTTQSLKGLFNPTSVGCDSDAYPLGVTLISALALAMSQQTSSVMWEVHLSNRRILCPWITSAHGSQTCSIQSSIVVSSIHQLSWANTSFSIAMGWRVHAFLENFATASWLARKNGMQRQLPSILGGS